MDSESATVSRSAAEAANPLLQPSSLPYGLPPFDEIEDQHFLPAFEAGMAEQRQQVGAIANNEELPTFENTIVALERSGTKLARTDAVFSNLVASNTNPTLEQIQREIAPRLAAHEDAIYLSDALFSRISLLHDKRDGLELDPVSLRLLERYYTQFVRAGAELDEPAKARLQELNQTLSTLTTRFRQAVLEATNDGAVVVDDPTRLDGLPEQRQAVARETASERGLMEGFVIALENTSTQPSLAELRDRDLRRRIFDASTSRGLTGEHATTALIADIVRARAERARLLGYESHAAYVLADATAQTPEAVWEMLGQLAPPALANARLEAELIQDLINRQADEAGHEPFELQPWDWQYYAEQVRRDRYAYDESEVRPYFELTSVLEDGVLFAAQELFGLRFEKRPDLPAYRDDVFVYEAFDCDGSPLGLVMFDWFARPNKRGGAWMNSFVKQSHLLDNQPVIATNLNVPKPPQGKPALLTYDEVETAFHEFGHALHGLLSDVRYPMLSGTSVPRDFVEYPSQYNEMWATNPRVLASYARHFKTGEPMPEELLQKVTDAARFNQGYATTEYLAAAMLDLAWHTTPQAGLPGPEGVVAFEEEALRETGIAYHPVPPRYRSTYFSHIFADPVGYSAGYYAYIWSEVLARDTEHWFHTHGGLNRENGDHLRRTVLSQGYTDEAMELFMNFKGAPPEIQPLLESRGLTRS